MLTIDLALNTQTGKLQVMHLKRYWSKAILRRGRQLKEDAFAEEWKTDVMLLNALGLGLEQTITYVYREAPSFEQFEDWILDINAGTLDQQKISRFNNLVTRENGDSALSHEKGALLEKRDLDFWKENGYIIVRNAVSRDDCDQTIEALCNFIPIDRNNPATWYNEHPAKQGIMVQFFQHPALEKNRNSNKIRTAF
jgi:hypothetical protein